MRIEDQPPPIPRNHEPVWQMVLADVARKPGPTWEQIRQDMADRDRIGRERYGTPLTTNNGRDHLVDAYQEALDMTVYLYAEMAEGAHTIRLRSLYERHLDNLHLLRTVMREREEWRNG